MPLSNVYAVIMAGGSGTRFWPASREKMPKQLLPLGADPDESLLKATVRRLGPLIPASRVYIATSERLIAQTEKELPNVPRAQLLAEPVARNTAPCIGWAAATIRRRDPNAIIAVLPADHYIGDEDGFRSVLTRAIHAAETGALVTVGVVPNRPETGYGYVEVGSELSAGVHTVARFVEKPTRDRAAEFVAGGKHLWNAGMFFFRAEAMLGAIGKHLPALAAGLGELDRAAVAGEEANALAKLFPTFQSISIDHGVMEKAEKIAVVPGNFGWNDVGSWHVTWELANKDPDGNALPAGAVAIDSKNNLVKELVSDGKKKLVALVGVNDLVVVETDDAILVMPRERAQDVRAVVDALRAKGDPRV